MIKEAEPKDRVISKRWGVRERAGLGQNDCQGHPIQGHLSRSERDV